MALGGKMDYAVHPIIAHKREHLVEVAYVGLYKKDGSEHPRYLSDWPDCRHM